MRFGILIVAAVLCFVVSGCNVHFLSSAPASPGKVYVSGAHGDRGSIWLCPSTAAGECEKVEVEIAD